MFNYAKALSVFKNFNKLSGKKRRKFVTGLLFDDEFIEWLFQPPKANNLSEMVSDMYAQFTKKEVMETFIEVIQDEGYHEFTRSHATFLFSVANIAISGNNDMLEEISQKKKAGEISSKEARRLADEIEDINDVIARLLKVSKKIVKREANRLAAESNLPKYICLTAMQSVPEPQYVDKFKIGFYLNNMLNTIYSEVEENGDFDKNPHWKEFFKYVFGKDNVVEVATFILLEGVHRIDKYDNSSEVRDCWDSLTSFALRTLNEAPEQLRTQMIELYIKRIDRMFQNKSFDLRVDLLKLNEKTFPNLTKTIEKYTDKIVSILSRNKN